jgi:hypothetical protein
LAFLNCSFKEIHGQRLCDSDKVKPCHCFETIKQIRCEKTTDSELTKEVLKTIGASISGDWDYLYISNTKLTAIDKDTFKTATFGKIIIQDNDVLKTIHEEAFKSSDTTELLQITSNKVLETSGLFKMAKLFGKGLKRVFLDKNNIVLIPDSAFSGDNDHFSNLEGVYLDAQQNLENIPTNFIKGVPKLLQVSLANNKIRSIADGAFDLAASSLTKPSHLTIFLDGNTPLEEDQLTASKFILPASPHVIRLDLEKCGISEFKPPFVKLITIIAKETDGKVYLSGNPITKCDCTNVKTLRNDPTKTNIWGIPPALHCTGNTKFDACPSTP